ncbi:MAG: hypothetical protein NVS9B10_08640 [Nevskia sp.]
MPLMIPKNVLEAAVGNGTIRRFREFALIMFDGEGAISVPNDVWLPAAAWARSRSPSGNRLRDRFQLLQRLDVLVTRRGTSMISTNGAHLRLARLRDAMKQDGVDLKEWNFPPDEILDQALSPAAPAKKAADEPEPAAAAPDDANPDPAATGETPPPAKDP